MQKRGRKPASERAAFGIENGEPTVLYAESSSYVVITSDAPRSILLSMMCGSAQGFTYVCSGGCPLRLIARLTTLPPSMRQNGGVSVHPPAISMRTGERPHTIWSAYTDSWGRCFTRSASVVSPSRSNENAAASYFLACSLLCVPPFVRWRSASERNMASQVRVRSEADSGRALGSATSYLPYSCATVCRSLW